MTWIELPTDFNELALIDVNRIVSIEKPKKKSNDSPNKCYVNTLDGKTFVVKYSYEYLSKIIQSISNINK